MKKTIIIGSGFASAVLTKALGQNSNLLIFDKSRGPGGRSSTRRVENVGLFDHGLQYISPTIKEFDFFLNQNLKSSIKEWNGNFHVFEDSKTIDSKKYIGKLGNNDFVKDLLSTKVEYLKELEGLERRNNKWTLQFKDKGTQDCERLILTIPLEQCQKITNSLNLNLNFEGSMEPNLTAMIAFNKPLKIPFAGIKFQKNPILEWAGNESSKLRIGNNENLELWTLQSSLDFAKKYCHIYRDKKEEVLELMIQEFLNLFEIKNVEISHKDIHGWLYAFKNKDFFNKFYWNKDINLGICGDWMCGPKAEDAWSSATLLANQINNS
jgi:renalase